MHVHDEQLHENFLAYSLFLCETEIIFFLLPSPVSKSFISIVDQHLIVMFYLICDSFEQLKTSSGKNY